MLNLLYFGTDTAYKSLFVQALEEYKGKVHVNSAVSKSELISYLERVPIDGICLEFKTVKSGRLGLISKLRSNGFEGKIFLIVEHLDLHLIEDAIDVDITSCHQKRTDPEHFRELIFHILRVFWAEVEQKHRIHNLTWAVEQSPSIVMITDTAGTIEYVNSKFTEISGFTPDEVLGKGVSFLASGSLSKEAYAGLWETIRHGCEWRGEFHNRRKDGGHYWEYAVIAPISDGDGQMMSYVKVAEDITQRKYLEEKDRINQKQLYQAAKMAALGTLASGIAHEINNPNQYIMGNLEIIADVWEDTRKILDERFHTNGDFKLGGLQYSKMRKRMSSTFERLETGAKRIKSIVRELRNYAAPTEMQFNESVDVNDVITSAISLSTNLISRSTNRFEKKLARWLPAVKGSSQQIEQVLINVLVNACQALESREQGIEIASQFDSDANAVIIKIKDEGIGIPSELLDQVTDPFFTTKRNNGGTGLGLSISSSIISEHGGTLQIESESKVGTVVTITLPAQGSDTLGTEEREE